MRNFRIWFLKPACQSVPSGGIILSTVLFRAATKQRTCALSDTLSARVLLCDHFPPLASMTDQNSYETTRVTIQRRRTRSTKWLVWTGVTCIAVAMICVAVTVFGMIYSFNVIATSETTPRPHDLAHDIRIASLPSFAAIPFSALGVILLVAGFIIRQPID